MPNDTKLNILIRIKILRLMKNHNIDFCGLQIHGNRHYLCNSLYTISDIVTMVTKTIY